MAKMGNRVIKSFYDYSGEYSHTRQSNQVSEVENGPQRTASPIEFNAVDWSPTNIVVTTADGEFYEVGDTVEGFTIIDNMIWFTDPMGDTAVTPFYDPSYYRKSKPASEVESNDGDDPMIH